MPPRQIVDLRLQKTPSSPPPIIRPGQRSEPEKPPRPHGPRPWGVRADGRQRRVAGGGGADNSGSAAPRVLEWVGSIDEGQPRGCAATNPQGGTNGPGPHGATTTRERAAVSIHLSSGGGMLRRVVLSCDVAGCPVQLEPPATERWRSDADAESWARDHAVGWTSDPVRQTDYCPEHAELSTVAAADVVPPRPTATVRDRAGNPLNRDEYAVRLRARLTDGGRSTGHAPMLTTVQAAVVARLLDELAGVYRGESLGTLAHELAVLLDSSSANRTDC